jgi:hypothetical protein
VPYSRPLPGAETTSSWASSAKTGRRRGGADKPAVRERRVEEVTVIRAESDSGGDRPAQLTREQWTAHYRSDRWASLRTQARVQLRYRCADCGRCRGLKLQLHHKHYQTFGCETLDDVEWVCAWCHRHRHRRGERKRTVTTSTIHTRTSSGGSRASSVEPVGPIDRVLTTRTAPHFPE